MEQEPAMHGAAGTPEARRNELALAEVKRSTTWSAFGGIIPVPVLDVVAVAGVQLNMLRRLAQIYDVPFSRNAAKSVIASLVGSLLPASAATTTAIAAAGMLKAVPVVGTAIGTLIMPSLSAGATYVIGMIFMQHFASGGTLLDFRAADYRDSIAAHSASLSGRAPHTERGAAGP